MPSNHKMGIPCHRPSPPLSLCLSSFGGVCVPGDGASVCSLCQEEHGRLRTLLCDLRNRKVNLRLVNNIFHITYDTKWLRISQQTNVQVYRARQISSIW